MNPGSRLKLTLNGRPLGFTKLDKSSKSVAFDIPAGSLKPSANRLVFSPELVAETAVSTCASTANIPALLVSASSKLNLTNTAPTPIADLSRLAGNGSLFNGEDGNAALILTARNVKDRAATLHFLGFAARQFGPKWVGADYYTTLPPRTELNKNILIIGPKTPIDAKLIASAPRAAKLAMGGTASIFPSPYSNGKLISIISATTPANYSRAMRSLSTGKYWNALQGGVTRWNNKSILMAQISKPAPQGFFPVKPKPSLFAGLKIKSFTDVKSDLGQWVSGIKIRKPKFFANTSASPKLDLPKLRGAANNIPTPALKRKFAANSTPKQAPLYASSVTFSNLQTSIASRFSKFKSSFEGFRNTGFTLQSADGLLDNIKRNRLAWMLILAGVGFFLLAFTSPREA